MFALNRRSLAARFLVLGFGLALGGGFFALPDACGDEPPAPPATQPTSRPATQPADPEADAQARRIIEAALARYRSARSYQDRVEGHVEVVALDRDGKDVGQQEKYAAALRYAKPNRLALVTDRFSIHCDGKQLWLYSGLLNQYTENPAPDRLDYQALVDEALADDPPHPVLYAIDQGDKTFAELFPMIIEFTAVARAERDGRPGQLLSGLLDGSKTPLDIATAVPFKLWFDDKTGLLGELRVEMTEALRKALGLTGEASEDDSPVEPGQPHRIDKAEATLRLVDVKLDVDIPTEQFTYRPEKDAKKVKEFDIEELMRMPNPEELVGKPAPPFAGDALDGQPLALEGLRGKVVVLDFWATWCGPCVLSLPNMQKIADAFKDKPVVFVGMNQDAKGMEAKARKFLEDKKVTFRQFPDPTGRLGREYKVAAIPCTFLIDAAGVVQAVHVGFDSKKPEEFSRRVIEQVEKLVRGEKLAGPSEGGPEPAERAPDLHQEPGR